MITRLSASPPVSAGIMSLVEKSLVRQVGAATTDEPRFDMLETVRAFGLEQLEANGETGAVRAAHAAHMLTVALDANERLFTAQFTRMMARLEAEQDNIRAALAWADGAAWSRDVVIAAVYAALDGIESPATATGVTPRERQVLRLLAQGRTDREIATALGITPRTVGYHVSNLLGKLGVESRTAAAAAVRLGLV